MNDSRPNPYPGPRSFQPGERLYGRQRETASLLDLLIAERVVLLYSPSGAGKTSLVQAALIPELEREGFRVLPVMRPGLIPEDVAQLDTLHYNRYALSLLLSLEAARPVGQQAPLAELAGLTLADTLDRLPAPDGGAWHGDVLIFDQFEEILTADPTDRAAKLACFEQIGQALRDRNRWALFAMREEFVASLDPYLRPIPARFDKGRRYRLDLLDPVAARQAMQGPAEAAGVAFTDEAATRLADDLRRTQVQQPDGSMAEALGPHIEPVQLQVVCRRLWDNLAPDDAVIDSDDLVAVGDVNTALRGYYADTVAAVATQTGVRERALREWADRQLITEAGIRGQVLMGQGTSQGLPNAAIWPLVDAHLVRAEGRRGATWFELAHDRLIEPVRGDNAEWAAAHLSTLQRQAQLWHEQGRSDGLLLSGDALAGAEAWAAARAAELEPHEREFLAACRRARERVERERRQSRRIKVLAVASVAAMIVALVLTGVALRSLDREESQKRLAHANLLSAQAQAAVERYPQKALLLALESLNEAKKARNEPVPELELALRDILTTVRDGEPLPKQTSNPVVSQISPDKKRFVAGGGDHDLWLWKLDDGQAEPQRLDDATSIAGAAFSGDNRWLVAAGDVSGNATLWDLQATTPISQPLGTSIQVYSGQSPFSKDSRWLLAYIPEGGEAVWDLQASPIVSRTLTRNWTDVSQFSPDFKWFVESDEENRVFLTNWQVTRPISIPLPIVGYGWTYSEDSHWLVSADENDTAILWNLRTSVPISFPLSGLSFDYGLPTFSQDSRWLVGADENDAALLWNLRTSVPITFSLNQRALDYGMPEFSEDSRWLKGANEEGEAILWNLQASPPVSQTLRIAAGTIAMSPDSRWLIGEAADGEGGILWDLQEARPVSTTLKGYGFLYLGASPFIPKSNWLLGDDGYEGFGLWNIEAPDEEPLYLEDSADWWNSTSFISPNGQWIALARDDHSVLVWHVGGSQTQGNLTPRVLRGHDRDVKEMQFLDDGHTLATLSVDGELRLWDLSPMKAPAFVTLERHDTAISAVAFYTTGENRLISLDNQGKVIASSLQQRDPESLIPVPQFLGDSTGVRASSRVLSPDGSWVAIYGPIKPSVWNILENESINEACRRADVSSTPFSSPDSRWLAFFTNDSSDTPVLNLCNVKSNDEIREVSLPNVQVPDGDNSSRQAWAIDADARWLARGVTAGTVDLWNITDVKAKPFPSLSNGSPKPITMLAFSPTEARLAVATENTVSLFDVTGNAAPVDLPLEPETKVTSIGFSPDGDSFAVGSENGRVQVWSPIVPNAEPETRSLPHTPILSLAFGAGDYERLIAAGSKDGAIYIINRDQEDQTSPRDDACKFIGRNLSLDEWRQFMGEAAKYEQTCEEWPAHSTVIEEKLNEGDELARKGDLKGAEKSFEEAVKLDPGLTVKPSERARSLRAGELYREGTELAEQGKISDATTKFKTAVDLDPSLKIVPKAEAIRLHAIKLAEQGDIEGATKKFIEALDLDPTLEIKPEALAKQIYAEKVVEDGRTLAKQGNVAGAIAKFSEARAFDPTLEIEPETEAKRIYAAIVLEQVRDLLEKNNFSGATDVLRRAAELAPEMGFDPDRDVKRVQLSVLLQQVQVLEEQGDDESAIEKRREASALLDVARPLASGREVPGTIVSGISDVWTFQGKTAQVVTIDMMAADDSSLDSYLMLYGPDLRLVDEDDDAGGNYNSRLRRRKLAQDGVYLLVAKGFDDSSAGAYRLSLKVE